MRLRDNYTAETRLITVNSLKKSGPPFPTPSQLFPPSLLATPRLCAAPGCSHPVRPHGSGLRGAVAGPRCRTREGSGPAQGWPVVSVSVPSVGTSPLNHGQNALLGGMAVEEILNFPSLTKLDLSPALCNAGTYHRCVCCLHSSIHPLLPAVCNACSDLHECFLPLFILSH